jgi:hypothetical protein
MIDDSRRAVSPGRRFSFGRIGRRKRSSRRRRKRSRESSLLSPHQRCAGALSRLHPFATFTMPLVAPCQRERVRSEITGLYRALMLDDGPLAEELLRYSKKAVTRLPFWLRLGRALLLAAAAVRLGPIVAEEIADRLEGKPVQQVHREVPLRTRLADQSKMASRPREPGPRRAKGLRQPGAGSQPGVGGLPAELGGGPSSQQRRKVTRPSVSASEPPCDTSTFVKPPRLRLISKRP